MKRRLVWRIIIVGIYLGIVFAVGFFVLAYAVSSVVNLVGAALTTIACAIVGLGIAFLYLGSLEENEEFILWENERVKVSRGERRGFSFPFSLASESIIKGDISGEAGPFDFFLTEFYGYSEEKIEGFGIYPQDQFVIRPRIFVKGKGSAQTKSNIGPISLPKGNYALRFDLHSGLIDAKFSLKKTVSKKPHEKLYDFGLTLLEVGVPILITGIISLGFGTSIN